MPFTGLTDAEIHAALNAAIAPLEKRLNALEEHVMILAGQRVPERPDPVPEPEPAPEPVVPAASGSVKDIQRAFDIAPDGGLVRIPFGDWDFDGMVTVKRNVGLIVVPGTALIDKSRGRKGHAEPCFMIESDEFYMRGLLLEGPRVDEPTGQAVGIRFKNSCRVDAEDVHLSNFTRAGFTHHRQRTESVYVRCSSDTTYRHLGENRWANGYGWEIYGEPENWNRPLYDDQGRAINLVRLYECSAHHCRHAIAANNGARFGLYGGRFTQDGTLNGGIVDGHGPSSHPAGTHYVEAIGNHLAGSPGRTWAGFGPRGGIWMITGNTFRNLNNDIVVMNESGAKYPNPDQHVQAHVWGHADGKPRVTYKSGATADQVRFTPPEEGFKYFETPEALAA